MDHWKALGEDEQRIDFLLVTDRSALRRHRARLRSQPISAARSTPSASVTTPITRIVMVMFHIASLAAAKASGRLPHDF